MNQPWSDLSNAHHIDWVIESLKDDPGLWTAAWNAAWVAARDAAWAAARGAARAALALIAYDDCDEYLKMSYEELRIWAALSEHPAAILLLSMVYVREKSHEPALV